MEKKSKSNSPIAGAGDALELVEVEMEDRNLQDLFDRFDSKKRAFLLALSQLGTVSEAARSVGIDRTTIYVWKQKDPDFARACESARYQGLENLADDLEKVAYERAREKSDVLTIFLLKGYRPHLFRERVEDRRQRVVVQLSISSGKGTREYLIDSDTAPPHPAIDVETETETE